MLETAVNFGMGVVICFGHLCLKKLELEKAVKEIKRLSGLFPICASCKKIRDDDGYWQQVETYISQRTEVGFSHSICPDCFKIHYPELKYPIGD